MNKSYPFDELKQLIDQAKAVSIYLSANPAFDEVAAALALKLALEKKGKQSSVLTSAEMTVEFSQLVGIDTVGKKNETGQNLVITFSYPLDQIDKVSYNDNDGKLNLVIQPKQGAPRVEKNQAQFFYEGDGEDLQIAIGVSNFQNLGEIAGQINPQKVVNITKSSQGNFGQLNIVDPAASSYSEMMVAILYNLGFMVDEDIANNLFLGLTKSTRNFSTENIGPDTFEAAAVCLRWGAKKSTGFAQKKPVFDQRPKTFSKQNFVSSAPSPDWFEPKIFKSSNI